MVFGVNEMKVSPINIYGELPSGCPPYILPVVLVACGLWLVAARIKMRPRPSTGPRLQYGTGIVVLPCRCELALIHSFTDSRQSTVDSRQSLQVATYELQYD
jgi:hypothetical protein